MPHDERHAQPLPAAPHGGRDACRNRTGLARGGLARVVVRYAAGRWSAPPRLGSVSAATISALPRRSPTRSSSGQRGPRFTAFASRRPTSSGFTTSAGQSSKPNGPARASPSSERVAWPPASPFATLAKRRQAELRLHAVGTMLATGKGACRGGSRRPGCRPLRAPSSGYDDALRCRARQR